jgi:hypothetical protein
VPQELAQPLEHVHPVRQSVGEPVELVRCVHEGHVDVGDEELGISAVEDDHPHRVVVAQRGQQVPQVRHQGGVENVDGRVVHGDAGDAVLAGDTQRGIGVVGHDDLRSVFDRHLGSRCILTVRPHATVVNNALQGSQGSWRIPIWLPRRPARASTRDPYSVPTAPAGRSSTRSPTSGR